MGGRKNQELFEIEAKQHNDLHEFIDNYDLPEGMQPRSPAPDSFGGPVRPWGRENGYLREFANQSLENRQFIVDNLRNVYKRYGVYNNLKEIFENESEIFLKGDKK